MKSSYLLLDVLYFTNLLYNTLLLCTILNCECSTIHHPALHFIQGSHYIYSRGRDRQTDAICSILLHFQGLLALTLHTILGNGKHLMKNKSLLNRYFLNTQNFNMFIESKKNEAGGGKCCCYRTSDFLIEWIFLAS